MERGGLCGDTLRGRYTVQESLDSSLAFVRMLTAIILAQFEGEWRRCAPDDHESKNGLHCPSSSNTIRSERLRSRSE